MVTKIDEIYEDIRGRIIFNKKLFGKNPRENIQKLSEIIKTVNIAKCDLVDLDMEIPNGTLYLMYLLQAKMKIPFGICSECKVISNKKGISIKCLKNSKLKCNGFLNMCPLKKKRVILEEEYFW